jgi:DNA-binding MarR family transcriptional regulator
MERLTPREVDAYQFVRSRSNPPPSLGELAAHLKVSQTRAAHLLRALQAKGWIVRQHGLHRALAVKCQLRCASWG